MKRNLFKHLLSFFYSRSVESSSMDTLPSEEARVVQEHLLRNKCMIISVPRDRDIHNDCKKHLVPLFRKLNIQLSDYFGSIRVGKFVDKEQERLTQESFFIILLITADFLANDIYNSPVMEEILEECSLERKIIIPVLCKKCGIKDTHFSTLQCIPRERPWISSWKNPDEFWQEVVKEIRPAMLESL